jgi:hypothetical protein
MVNLEIKPISVISYHREGHRLPFFLVVQFFAGHLILVVDVLVKSQHTGNCKLAK